MTEGPESRAAASGPWAREGETLEGKFRVGATLGRGGMGVVVAAHHLDLDEPVALKFLLPAAASHPTAVERFLREARASAKLKSPHVTRVFDVGRTSDQTPYIVMERLHGEDLWSRMRRCSPLPIAEAVGWMLEVCEPLEEAHEQGIIHRDLKPQNIFLARGKNGKATIKLLDFGISRATTAENDLTRANELLGTPHFMSPEQYRDARAAGPASDIYSLGACLFCLLTQRPPFMGGDLLSLSAKVLGEEAPSVRTLRPDVPEALAHVIERCLAKAPDARYPSARALRDALAELAAPTATPASAAHIDDETILAMQEGRLGSRSAAVEAHLAECDECRAVVAAASPSKVDSAVGATATAAAFAVPPTGRSNTEAAPLSFEPPTIQSAPKPAFEIAPTAFATELPTARLAPAPPVAVAATPPPDVPPRRRGRWIAGALAASAATTLAVTFAVARALYAPHAEAAMTTAPSASLPSPPASLVGAEAPPSASPPEATVALAASAVVTAVPAPRGAVKRPRRPAPSPSPTSKIGQIPDER